MLFVQWKCANTLQTPSLSVTTTSMTDLEICPIVNATDTCPSMSQYEPDLLSNSAMTSFGFPINQEILCQGSTVFLKCPSNQVLHIQAGYYGIQLKTAIEICVNTTGLTSIIPTMCYVSEDLDTIKSSCEYQNKCLVNSSNLGVPNLYPLLGKQLLLQVSMIKFRILIRRY